MTKKSIFYKNMWTQKNCRICPAPANQGEITGAVFAIFLGPLFFKVCSYKKWTLALDVIHADIY